MSIFTGARCLQVTALLMLFDLIRFYVPDIKVSAKFLLIHPSSSLFLTYFKKIFVYFCIWSAGIWKSIKFFHTPSLTNILSIISDTYRKIAVTEELKCSLDIFHSWSEQPLQDTPKIMKIAHVGHN